jgi:hypothetical protein
MVIAFAIWLQFLELGAQLDVALTWAAIAVAVGFALWGCVVRGQPEANSFGAPVTA